MKKKILVVGLIVALMVGGLVLIGCETSCPSGGCSVKTSGDGSKSFSGCSKSSCASWESYASGAGANPCDC